MFWHWFNYGCEWATLKKGGKPAVLTHIDDFGVYNIDVVDAVDKENGSKASFIVAANKKGGSILKTVSICGKYNEHVQIEWHEGQQHPRLKYSAEPEGNDEMEQKFKILFRKCT